jgi:SAM-dependent methyltransferase
MEPPSQLEHPEIGKTRMTVIRGATWSAAPAATAEYLGLLPRFGADPAIGAWAETYARGHTGRLLWDVDFLVKNFRFSSCLNIGAAPFIFEYLLRKQRPDIRLRSVDLDVGRFPHAADILGLDIAQMDFERADAATIRALGQFQCVVFCEIFEHLRIDILRTMRLLRELLAPDGILYLTTPNGGGSSALRKHLFRGRTGPDPVSEWSKLETVGHMGHVREYSFREVRDVLEFAGFTIDRYGYRRRSRGSRWRDTPQSLLRGIAPAWGSEIVLAAR